MALSEQRGRGGGRGEHGGRGGGRAVASAVVSAVASAIAIVSRFDGAACQAVLVEAQLRRLVAAVEARTKKAERACEDAGHEREAAKREAAALQRHVKSSVFGGLHLGCQL